MSETENGGFRLIPDDGEVYSLRYLTPGEAQKWLEGLPRMQWDLVPGSLVEWLLDRPLAPSFENQ